MSDRSGLVKCASGYTYAQRPVSFTHDGKEYRVREIAAEWREPEAKKFIILTTNDRRFELNYLIESQQWQIRLLGPDRANEQGDKANYHDE